MHKSPPLEFSISHFLVTVTFPVCREKRELLQGISITVPTWNLKNVPYEKGWYPLTWPQKKQYDCQGKLQALAACATLGRA